MAIPRRYATGGDNLARKTEKDDGRKKMDPNAPKRGLSAYMFFANEAREKVREENPGIKSDDVGKIVGEKWKSFSEEQKAPFEAKAAAEKKRYEEEKAAYVAAGSAQDPDRDETTKQKSLEAESACRLFERSIRRYGTLLLALQRNAPQSTHLTTTTVPELKDEFSRLRIWGEQTYAVLPRNARRSLDEQLREDEETKNIVIRTLQRLDNHIGRAIDQTVKHSSTASVDEEDEEYSSLSDESDTAQESPQSAWEVTLRKTISMMFEAIRSLYRISILLRRPRNSSKYLKSSNSTIPSHDALKVTMDYAHVVEKIRQWRYLTMRSKVGSDEEHVVTEEEIQSRKENDHQEVADIAYLCQRLTWANLFRRKQFDYWIDYPDVPESQEPALTTDAKRDQLKGQTFSALHASFSTVAKSALGEDNNGEQWHTVYARSAVGRSNSTRVPDVLRCSKTHTNFECPFCHIVLDSNSMQKREVWKKHVFRDLRPYVCSFEDCPDPGRLFITRHDWIYHEQQMHRRKWTCPCGCAKSLSSKAAMIQHLTTEHSYVVNERQVSTYADMCEREIDDTAPSTCLICSQQMSLSRLHDHLATHMEEIALFVLPLTPDDDEEEEGEEEQIKEIAEVISEHDEEDEQIEEIADIGTHDEQDEQIKENPENPDASDHLIWESETAQEAADDTRSLEFIDQYQQLATDHQALPSFADRWRSRNRETGSQVAADDLLDSPFQYDIEEALRPGKIEQAQQTEKMKDSVTFQCTLCPKKFTRAYNLRSHLRTHTDEKPFVCAVCGKAFARQHERKRHEDTVHKDGAIEWSAADQSRAADLG